MRASQYKIMPIYRSLSLFGFVMMTLLISSCREDLDDCLGVQAVEVEFITGLNFDQDTDPEMVPLDTFREGTFIEFQANSNDLLSYEWHLENNPQVFNGANPRILFDVGTAGDVDVTLVGDDRGFSLGSCLTEEEQVDSTTKTITIIPVENCAVLGRYEGYRTSAPEDVFEVEIKLRDGTSNFYELSNFPNGCIRTGNVIPLRVFISHRHFEMLEFGITNNEDCPLPSGFGVLDEMHKTLMLDFDIYDRESNSTLSDKFIATKID